MQAPDIPEVKAERPKVVAHDETPSGITDHAFEPRGEWYTLCMHCGFAQSAHAETTIDKDHIIRVGYISDDFPEEDL